jgi:hypothetical protein
MVSTRRKKQRGEKRHTKRKNKIDGKRHTKRKNKMVKKRHTRRKKMYGGADDLTRDDVKNYYRGCFFNTLDEKSMLFALLFYKWLRDKYQDQDQDQGKVIINMKDLFVNDADGKSYFMQFLNHMRKESLRITELDDVYKKLEHHYPYTKWPGNVKWIGEVEDVNGRDNYFAETVLPVMFSLSTFYIEPITSPRIKMTIHNENLTVFNSALFDLFVEQEVEILQQIESDINSITEFIGNIKGIASTITDTMVEPGAPDPQKLSVEIIELEAELVALNEKKAGFVDPQGIQTAGEAAIIELSGIKYNGKIRPELLDGTINLCAETKITIADNDTDDNCYAIMKSIKQLQDIFAALFDNGCITYDGNVGDDLFYNFRRLPFISQKMPIFPNQRTPHALDQFSKQTYNLKIYNILLLFYRMSPGVLKGFKNTPHTDTVVNISKNPFNMIISNFNTYNLSIFNRTLQQKQRIDLYTGKFPITYDEVDTYTFFVYILKFGSDSVSMFETWLKLRYAGFTHDAIIFGIEQELGEKFLSSADYEDMITAINNFYYERTEPTMGLLDIQRLLSMKGSEPITVIPEKLISKPDEFISFHKGISKLRIGNQSQSISTMLLRESTVKLSYTTESDSVASAGGGSEVIGGAHNPDTITQMQTGGQLTGITSQLLDWIMVYLGNAIDKEDPEHDFKHDFSSLGKESSQVMASNVWGKMHADAEYFICDSDTQLAAGVNQVAPHNTDLWEYLSNSNAYYDAGAGTPNNAFKKLSEWSGSQNIAGGPLKYPFYIKRVTELVIDINAKYPNLEPTTRSMSNNVDPAGLGTGGWYTFYPLFINTSANNAIFGGSYLQQHVAIINQFFKHCVLFIKSIARQRGDYNPEYAAAFEVLENIEVIGVPLGGKLRMRYTFVGGYIDFFWDNSQAKMAFYIPGAAGRSNQGGGMPEFFAKIDPTVRAMVARLCKYIGDKSHIVNAIYLILLGGDLMDHCIYTIDRLLFKTIVQVIEKTNENLDSFYGGLSNPNFTIDDFRNAITQIGRRMGGILTLPSGSCPTLFVNEQSYQDSLAQEKTTGVVNTQDPIVMVVYRKPDILAEYERWINDFEKVINSAAAAGAGAADDDVPPAALTEIINNKNTEIDGKEAEEQVPILLRYIEDIKKNETLKTSYMAIKQKEARTKFKTLFENTTKRVLSTKTAATVVSGNLGMWVDAANLRTSTRHRLFNLYLSPNIRLNTGNAVLDLVRYNTEMENLLEQLLPYATNDTGGWIGGDYFLGVIAQLNIKVRIFLKTLFNTGDDRHGQIANALKENTQSYEELAVSPENKLTILGGQQVRDAQISAQRNRYAAYTQQFGALITSFVKFFHASSDIFTPTLLADAAATTATAAAAATTAAADEGATDALQADALQAADTAAAAADTAAAAADVAVADADAAAAAAVAVAAADVAVADVADTTKWDDLLGKVIERKEKELNNFFGVIAQDAEGASASTGEGASAPTGEGASAKKKVAANIGASDVIKRMITRFNNPDIESKIKDIESKIKDSVTESQMSLRPQRLPPGFRYGQ